VVATEHGQQDLSWGVDACRSWPSLVYGTAFVRRTVSSGCRTPTTPSKLPNAESASGWLIAKKHVHPTTTIAHTPRKGTTSRVITKIIRTSGAVEGNPRR
jgi:hypothetical protein